MKHYLKLVSLVSSGALLGCSQLSLSPAQRESTADTASVLSRVRLPAERKSASAAAEIEHFWLQGKTAQNQDHLALARQYYARVLQRQPGHVGALNALAVIEAQSGRLDEAIAQFQRALVLDPTASHLYNNLGYALLLAGRLDEAEATLARAQGLNPASSRTQKNRELLAQARARGATVQQAQAEPQPLAQETSTATTEVAGAHLRSVAPNVYELRDPLPGAEPVAKVLPPAAAAALASVPQAARLLASATPVSTVAAPPVERRVAPVLLQGMRIEVSNGVGVRHMARRTAERLAPLGVVAHLTNQPGYQQPRTEIQYLPSQAQAAQALAGQLPQTPHMQATRQLGGNTQMRLVLGHDKVARAMVAWLDAGDEPAVSQTGEDEMPVALSLLSGWRWS